MKSLKLFILDTCPYCRATLTMMDELLVGSDYKEINVEIIEERREKQLADSYDYYYVPSIFYKEEKIHEGVLNKEELRKILDFVVADNE